MIGAGLDTGNDNLGVAGGESGEDGAEEAVGSAGSVACLETEALESRDGVFGDSFGTLPSFED